MYNKTKSTIRYIKGVLAMDTFYKNFEELFEKYSELLTGDSTQDVVGKVKIWALYSHMKKTMPALVQHWHQQNPESNQLVRQIFEDVQKLNQEHKAQLNATTKNE